MTPARTALNILDRAIDSLDPIPMACVRNAAEEAILSAFDGNPSDLDEAETLTNTYLHHSVRAEALAIIRAIDLDEIRRVGLGGAA
jgi:hypothetical protein